jgi:aminoglycoside phosphotransferase (APT) family kinase protein
MSPLAADSKDAIRLATHLRAQAHHFFPETTGQPVTVRLVRAEARPFSALYTFSVQAVGQERILLVKVPARAAPDDAAGAGAESQHDRPRLVPRFDAATSSLLEHAALSSVYRHFEQLGDSRFGAIRVYALLPYDGALVMERVSQPSLRALLMTSVRWSGQRQRSYLEAAFRNAGAWLRQYHAIDGHDPATTRHATRTDVMRFVGELTAYLGREAGDTEMHRRLDATMRGLAEDVLPDLLPLGLAHGDYALRNILVSDRARITVCDTRARWRTSIYEDIGYFLVSLKFGGAQLYSQGLAFPPATIAACEQNFLAGYFDNGVVPRRAVQLYEIMALLDKTAWVASTRTASGSLRSRILRSAGLFLLLRASRRSIRHAAAVDPHASARL